MSERTWVEVGAVVKDLRKQRGLKQEEVAAASEGLVSLANLRIVEKGGRENYRDRTITGMERALRLPAGWIMRLKAGEPLEALQQSLDAQVVQEMADVTEALRQATPTESEFREMTARMERIEGEIRRLTSELANRLAAAPSDQLAPQVDPVEGPG